MKHIKSFESFSQENYIVDEGLRDITKGVTSGAKKLFAEKPVTQEEALKIIMGHPAKRMLYKQYKKTNPEIADLYVKFIEQNPSNLYAKWDGTKWIDAGKYKAAVGEVLI
jgi:hypothetical protein